MNASKEAIVKIRPGSLEGQYQNGLFTFKGIPYAAPPIGKLRWQAPQPVKPWKGVRPARQYGAISVQSVMNVRIPGAPDFSNQPQSEDCLFLNIWTPGLDGARRPVMFWIHGGAFIIGSGSEGFFEGGNLARRGNIVLVTINYRLGAAGFLNLKESTGGRIASSGNEGLLDQIAALDWVKENIEYFGGNPDNITIFGFSAGGMSAGTLLGMPAAQGKFHKAMNRSGAANIISPLGDALKITEQYLSILGIKGTDTDALFQVSTSQLLEAQQQLSLKLMASRNKATPFQPVVDGFLIKEPPMDAIRKGSAKNIPVVCGNTLDELKSSLGMNPAFQNLDEEGLINQLKKSLPADRISGVVKMYRLALINRGVKATPLEILGSINTDMMFRLPTIRLVEAQRDNGAPAYNYLFAYKSPALGGRMGSPHGLDNPLLFGNPDPEFTGIGPEVENLANKLQDSAAAFAWTGNPSCSTTGPWPEYGKTRQTMIFDLQSRVETAPYESERLALEKC